ncbi:MAG: KH domain-containing protein [Epsilonproteobacteria bacterium]|nr:KH domain-containing protein [Campylobacterota bacterium]
MVVEFVTEYAKLLSFEPEKIKSEVVPHGDFDEIIIYAKKGDVGRIIGKSGSMVKSIKMVISGCRAKEDKNYKITVKPYEE